MEVKHAPNWIEVSVMLSEAMEQYQDQHYYSSLPKVIDDLIDYIEQYSGKWLNEKTIKRDAGNRPDSKKLNRLVHSKTRTLLGWQKSHKIIPKRFLYYWD